MGNRAVITTQRKDLGIYMHWNGGADTVKPLLKYCKAQGYRTPEDDSYGWARLCQVIGNFFGGSLSVGVGKYENLDTNNYDNGVYIIKDWEIIGREYYTGAEQNEYDEFEMLKTLDQAMPEGERLGETKLKELL